MYKWFILYLTTCSAYKILVVFPVPGKSHSILGNGYVNHLLAAGHEVTYITPVPHKNPPPNLRVVDISESFQVHLLGDVFDVEKIMNKELNMQSVYIVKNIFVNFANGTLNNPNVKRLMEDPNERFDAVLVEWLYTEIYSGFSLVFDCPLIWASSMDPHAMVLSLIDQIPNPAYTADHMSQKHPPFTFWERVNELWTLACRLYEVKSLNPKESQIYDEGFAPFVKKKGLNFVPINEVMYNGSLMLGNSHVSFGQPLAIPQNYKSILGYHIPKTIEPLPKNIQKIMDNATHGVIYFSMGSMLKGKSLPRQFKLDLVEIFRGLPQIVIWKFEEKPSDLPENVHVVDWVPQMSLLAHPNCVLFISHGGLLSITEAIHFAVPIIGVPVFADQFLNMDRVVLKGFGRKVNLDPDFTKNMKDSLTDVLSTPRYRQKAEEVSWIYHHRLATPGVELVHWVEHVIKTGGAPHLRSLALFVPFYQKFYLDLAAIVIAIVIILAITIKRLLRYKNVDIKKKTK